MNVINKIKNIVDDIKTVPKDLKYITDRKEATREIVEKAHASLEPIQLKVDEKLEELKELKEGITSSTIKEFQEHFTTMKHTDNFGFSQKEFDAILNALELTQKESSEVKAGDLVQKLHMQITFIKNLDEDLTKEEVDYYHSQALEYARNIKTVVDNYSEVIRLVYNTIALMKRYATECNKLNQQTEHIREEIGDNYKTYTSKQKYLVQKHIYSMSKLLQLLQTPILQKDGSLNHEMSKLLEVANTFLNDAGENVFISFKKKNRFWMYSLISVVLFVTLGFSLYLTLN